MAIHFFVSMQYLKQYLMICFKWSEILYLNITVMQVLDDVQRFRNKCRKQLLLSFFNTKHKSNFDEWSYWIAYHWGWQLTMLFSFWYELPFQYHSLQKRAKCSSRNVNCCVSTINFNLQSLKLIQYTRNDVFYVMLR